MAQWKDIAGYEGLYLVSDEGDVYSLPRKLFNGRGEFVRKGMLLKPGIRGNELKYYFVVLSDGNEQKKYSVHRLVADAFVENPNPENLVVINHIDHDTLNNKAVNLEWCTQQYNNEYGHNKKIRQYTVNGDFVSEHKSIKAASNATKISRTAINNVLCGWAKTAGGYVWEYVIEEE